MITTILIGIYFIVSHGFLILPIGLAGILIIISYTQWLNRYPLLCLFAPGIAFGPLIVMGTHVILTGQYSGFTLFVSLIPFLLANNLLLLNQFPDIEADKSVGRRHFPIAYGVQKSSILYGIIALSVCATIAFGVLRDVLPQYSIFALVPMTGAIPVFYGAMNHQASIDKFVPFMGLNVVATILTPVILGLAIIYS